MNELISKASSILIIPRQEHDLDVLAATFALSLSLKQLGKKITLYIKPDIYSEKVKVKFPPQNIRFLSKDEPGTVVITLDNIEAGIKEIKWKEEEGKVNIYITTDKGDINKEKIKINEIKSAFDLTILVGVNKPESLNEFYKNHMNYFQQDNTLVFANGEITFKNKIPVKYSTLSESMLRWMLEQGMILSSQVVTNLLAGIYWKTNGFRDEMHNDLFSAADQLVKLGADQEQARSIALETVGFASSLYFADVYGNIKAAGNGIFYSIVPEKRLLPNGDREVLFKDFVPTSQLIGCRIAYVILHGDELNTVYIHSNSILYDLKPLLDKYKGTGTSWSGHFITATPIEGLEELMVQELKNLIRTSRAAAKAKREGAVQPQTQPQTQPSTLIKTREPAQVGPYVSYIPTDNSIRPLEQEKPQTQPAPEPFMTFKPREKKPKPAEAPVSEAKPEDTKQQSNITLPEFTQQTTTPDPFVMTAPVSPASKSSVQDTSTGSVQDPLAAAEKLPEPLRLEEDAEQLVPPAPMSPLPPSSF